MHKLIYHFIDCQKEKPNPEEQIKHSLLGVNELLTQKAITFTEIVVETFVYKYELFSLTGRT